MIQLLLYVMSLLLFFKEKIDKIQVELERNAFPLRFKCFEPLSIDVIKKVIRHLPNKTFDKALDQLLT